MATLRKWLDKEGFDWKTGVIVWHDTGDDGDSPGWSNAVSRQRIQADHPILDKEFDCGYGGPECPRIIARDKEAIYFPSQYDGATSLERIVYDIDWYVQDGHETPYPGG